LTIICRLLSFVNLGAGPQDIPSAGRQHRALKSSDSWSNLQPLQWENNRSKGDSTSGNYCKVAA
jgi:hypothetical protein